MNDPIPTQGTVTDAWSGLDATVRRLATPVAISGGVALAVWSVVQAMQGEKLGGIGSLLVLIVVGAIAAKLAAETYVFASLGGDPTPRQRSAQRMIGPLVVLTRVRYLFGCLGGIILPLGAQILASGSKNIPAALDAGPPAVCAVLAAICLLISEPAERRLFVRAMDPSLELPAQDGARDVSPSKET